MVKPSIDSGMKGSFIEFAEGISEDIAEWAADYIDEVIGVLSPRGKAFGQRKQPEREQVYNYVTQLKGNQQAWADWIGERVSQIQKQLMDSGLDEELITATHPTNIAIAMAIKYSSRMEALVDEERQKHQATAERYVPPATFADYKALEEPEDDEDDRPVLPALQPDTRPEPRQ